MAAIDRLCPQQGQGVRQIVDSVRLSGDVQRRRDGEAAACRVVDERAVVPGARDRDYPGHGRNRVRVPGGAPAGNAKSAPAAPTGMEMPSPASEPGGHDRHGFQDVAGRGARSDAGVDERCHGESSLSQVRGRDAGAGLRRRWRCPPVPQRAAESNGSGSPAGRLTPGQADLSTGGDEDRWRSRRRSRRGWGRPGVL